MRMSRDREVKRRSQPKNRVGIVRQDDSGGGLLWLEAYSWPAGWLPT